MRVGMLAITYQLPMKRCRSTCWTVGIGGMLWQPAASNANRAMGWWIFMLFLVPVDVYGMCS